MSAVFIFYMKSVCKVRTQEAEITKGHEKVIESLRKVSTVCRRLTIDYLLTACSLFNDNEATAGEYR